MKSSRDGNVSSSCSLSDKEDGMNDNGIVIKKVKMRRLLTNITEGRFAIPKLQREFV